jgi:hypothetical protein
VGRDAGGIPAGCARTRVGAAEIGENEVVAAMWALTGARVRVSLVGQIRSVLTGPAREGIKVFDFFRIDFQSIHKSKENRETYIEASKKYEIFSRDSLGYLVQLLY